MTALAVRDDRRSHSLTAEAVTPALVAACLFLAATAFAKSPADPPFHATKLKEIDEAITQAIAEGKTPGGVLWIEHAGNVYKKAFGNRTLLPEPQPAALDTIYDAASLTKVVATTPSIMLLIERGQLSLDDKVKTHLPKFTGDGKEDVTIRQLLVHTSGMRPGIPRDPAYSGVPEALERIYAEKTLTAPGTAFLYSDINFILLGEIVRKITGKPLDHFARDEIFIPLKMTDTVFLPPASKRDRIAPTTREETASGDTLVHGTVHDPTSRRMGGVAGHAGLFLTAADLARYSRMLLNGGSLDNVRIFKPETIALMTRVATPPDLSVRRALGWDVDSRYSDPRGAHFLGGYGHTGWTGTSVWVEPDAGAFVVFLSNRNHIDEKGSVKDLRHVIGTLAAESLPGFSAGTVQNGIDVLAASDFKALQGLKIGLITNHTGRARTGESTIDLLHRAPGVSLKALFSPEHGIRGHATGSVSSDIDPETGLAIHSLYRDKLRRPTPEQLRGLDALVFDIQDIGCRFYTYISTMGNCMEAAAEHGLRFIVLDRVNPIGGQVVEGPVLKGERSFTGYHEIPVRHGMTAGELARMFRDERKLDLELTVVEVEGWRREMYFDETGRAEGGAGFKAGSGALEWVNPSPNMRSLTEAILYPGIGLLEFMKLSVGRGTEIPFEHFGAPYIDSEILAARLNAEKLPGVRFEPTRYTPDASVFKNEACGGVRIRLTDRESFQSVHTGIVVARILYELYADSLDFERFRILLVHEATFEAVKAGKPVSEIEALWVEDLEKFKARRQGFLIYEGKSDGPEK